MPSRPRLLGVHILLVSVDPGINNMLRELLRREGAAVSVADTAAAALELVEAHGFDTAVIELGLPDMTDAAVLGALAAHSRRGMRIAVMSRRSEVDLAGAIAAGAERIFPMPLDWHRLLWYLEATRRPGAGLETE